MCRIPCTSRLAYQEKVAIQELLELELENPAATAASSLGMECADEPDEELHRGLKAADEPCEPPLRSTSGSQELPPTDVESSFASPMPSLQSAVQVVLHPLSSRGLASSKPSYMS